MPEPSTTPDIEDIRPIREAVNIPAAPTPVAEYSWIPTALWVAAGLLTLAAIIALVIWLKRRAAANRIPNLQQRALRQLTDTQPLITPETSREYTIAVSDILRSFIEARFHLPSTRRTTPEFLKELTENSNVNLGPYRESLSQFFHESDFGKFSGNTLSVEAMTSLQQSATEVIQSESSPLTTPKSQPASH